MLSTALMHVTLSTHNFAVSRLTPRARELVMQFARGNMQMGLVRAPGGRYTSAPVKVFAASVADKSKFRFHINQLKDFEEYLGRNYINESLYTVERKLVPVGVAIETKVIDLREPRDEQPKVIAYLGNEDGNRSKFVDLQTGHGKTFCALTDIANYGQRVACIVKPGYIEKWIGDFKGYFDCVNSDIMVVKGSVHLMGLLQMAKDGKLKSKFIIISNKTLQNYLKFYEQMQEGILDMGYACLPENLFEYLGSGLRLIDEVHQDFHLNFKIDLYTNVAKSVSLSATLLNNDPFIERMYKLAYPVEKRYTGVLDKYVVAKAVMYSLQSNTYVRTTEFGSTSYSHIAFEKSIMKNHIVRDTYFKLIANTVGISFIKNYVKGDKCAVFCASIDMCTELTKYLQKQYPHLDVRRYVAEDPYENLIEPDIRVTTILSGGTAHDIPGLTTVVLTIGIDSIQANIQTVGRLRKIKDRAVNFLYLVCNDIPKQLEYHGRKEKMLQQRAHSFQIINAPFPV